MITAIVTMPLPESFTYEGYLANTKKIADRFQKIPGLIRKNFLYSEETRTGGGVYLWESREAADTCYAGPWRDAILETFGIEPNIVFYKTPVVVDNAAGEIVTVAA